VFVRVQNTFLFESSKMKTGAAVLSGVERTVSLLTLSNCVANVLLTWCCQELNSVKRDLLNPKPDILTIHGRKKISTLAKFWVDFPVWVGVLKRDESLDGILSARKLY
jgi:hypothetical protein